MTYALTITVDLPFPAALEATREALGAGGFGVISDIDLQSTFSDKLGPAAASELGDYRILGACNPHLARKALNSEQGSGSCCRATSWSAGGPVRRPPRSRPSIRRSSAT